MGLTSSRLLSRLGNQIIFRSTMDDFNRYTASASVFWPQIEGCLPPVRNQGNTWSCGAFALATCMYAQMYLDGTTPKLCSSQQLLDIYPDGTQLQEYFIHARDMGLFTEEHYPWRGFAGEVEWPNTANFHRFSIRGFFTMSKPEQVRDELKVRPAIATSLFMSKSYIEWNREGIFHYTEADIYAQSSESIDEDVHVVVLVGFGEENGEKYFFAMDSMGQEIANRGYIKIGEESIIYSIAVIGPVTEYVEPRDDIV